jgi:hypothetical protein
MQARWRRENPERQALVAAQQSARIAALRRLAGIHPDEFDNLYITELRRRGLPLPRTLEQVAS